MQATLDITALKPFTRALNCLLKYGEELTIHATPDTLSLSAVNSSKSAYCRFKYEASFFSRYNVGNNRTLSPSDEPEKTPSVNGQLLTKSLLSILKHRTVERSADKCELSIVEGTPAGERDNEEHDSLESKLIVKLHCKHGIVKTHRLLMLVPTALLAPSRHKTEEESRVTIGPRALKDVIDHFSIKQGAKSDPQLVWTFADSELVLKSSESSIGNKGREQLSTELILSADEFDDYEIFSSPTTIAFHLREFNAAIAFTDSMSLSLEMRFTEPAAPLFIDVEGDAFDCLFVLSTNQVAGSQGATQSQASNPANRKREGDDMSVEPSRMKRPMKAAQHVSTPASGTRSTSDNRPQSRPQNSMGPPPSSAARSMSMFSQPPLAESTHRDMPPPPVPAWAPSPPAMKEPSSDAEPLFLPCSQLSQAEVEVLKSTGLGIEDMNADEFVEMLEGEGEEVDFSNMNTRERQVSQGTPPGSDSFGLVDEFGATQSSDSTSKGFQPLFED